MPNILNLKPDEIDTKEKRSKYVVSVLGCGQKGILYANAFADAGFKIVCSDSDQSVIKKLAKGKTSFAEQEIEGKLKSLIASGQLSVINELKKAVSQSDVIIITVPAKVDDKKKIDNSEALNVCKQVGSALHSGMLVIYGDVAGLGFTEGIMKETLEDTSGLKVGQDFGLAYCPIQNSGAKPNGSFANMELKFAAIGKASQDTAMNILKTIAKSVKQIDYVKTAEIATLFMAAKEEANRALASELAVFCENAKADYFEVLRFLESNDPSFWPTTVEEQTKNEAYLLLESAENLNVKLRLLTLARQINEEMVKHAVNLTQDALRRSGKTLRRTRIAVLGTVNLSNSTAVFVKMLELKGAKVSLYDPASKRILDSGMVTTSLNEAVEGADCIVILTGEEQFRNLNLRKLKPLAKTPAVIVDLAGAFEPQKVEAEGFLYCGLGRGKEENRRF